MVLAVASVVVFVGVLYTFPNVDMMTDRCLECGRTRIYLQIEGAQYGSTMYNLNIEAAGNISHHHKYTDAQYAHLGMMPRWKLRPSGKQSD